MSDSFNEYGDNVYVQKDHDDDLIAYHHNFQISKISNSKTLREDYLALEALSVSK